MGRFRTAMGKSSALLILSLLGFASFSGMDIASELRKVDPAVLLANDPRYGGYGASLPVFIHLDRDDPEFSARLANLGGSGKRIAARLHVGRIPPDAARYLSNWPQVAYIEGAKRARPLLNLSRPAVSADVVQAGTGMPPPFASGITGAGMFVGVVDTGLDNAHLDFHTGGAGSPDRVKFWYPNPASATLDTDGHGTHVTGIAAGNGFMSTGLYTGMAPGADILFAKTTFVTTDILTAATDMIAYAESVSRPIPVNLSLGLMVGPHDGSSGFEAGIDALAEGTPGSRRLVLVAAGNEVGYDEHFQANVPPFSSVAADLSLNFGPRSAIYGGTVEIWADGSDSYRVTVAKGTDSVTVAAGASGSSPGGINVSNKISAPPNGASLIAVFFPSGAGAASITLSRTRNAGTGRIDAYIDYTDGTFGTPTDAGTIIEPANGKSVLAVGSYKTKNFGGSPASQAISTFSSMGPTRDGTVKPDVTAPGEYIFSTRSFDAPDQNYSGIVNGNVNYAILRGTSMATPHLTGIAALVWQSNPALTGAQMRERLRRTTNAPTDGSATPNTTWGYGKANALAAVKNSVASITAPKTALPGTAVPLASDNSSGAFGNALTARSWSLLQQPPGSAVVLSAATPSASFTPIVPGDYTVGLAVSQTTPAGTPAGSASAVVHVNNVPAVASISGPAFSADPSVSFKGTGTDPDGRPLTYRWILVSRPAGSNTSSGAPYFVANGDNVTLFPDIDGIYEIGLRVDDGLDNSALSIFSFSAGAAPPPPPATGGGGGGGCSMAQGPGDDRDLAPWATVAILLSPLAALAVRRRAIRRT